VVDQPRHTSAATSIEIVSLIQIEDVDTVVASTTLALEPLFLAFPRFGFRDPFARVFDDSRAVRDVDPRIDATPVNGRIRRAHPSRG
jgi:hypothetical protein